MADRRDRWIAGQGRRNVEDARRKAAANTAEVLMSQSAKWFKDRENLSRAKNVLQHIPAVTTDQNEKRNMYQMLMNQMKGGDRGARLIDTSGLPSIVQENLDKYRRGRRMFQDPSKAQGLLGDIGSLFSGNNRAAVYADEYNPFPMAGFGADWYKDKFKFASGLGSLMEAAENFIPYIGTAKRMLSKEREPLERDPRYTPVPGSADWESSVFDPVEDIDDYIYTGEFPGDPRGTEDSGYYGRIEEEPLLSPPGIAYPGYNQPVTDLGELFPLEPETNEIFNEEVFNKVYELTHPTGQTEAEIPEYFDLYETPWNLFETLKESAKEDEFTDQEILDFLLKKGNLKDNTLEEY